MNKASPASRRTLERVITGAAGLTATAVGLAGFFVSCGPSVQSIYEGKVRFEHCYRLDLDERITKGHREACWNQWIGTYSYGQPRDRIEYARRRVRSLEMGDPEPPRLNLDSQRQPSQRQFYLSVPAPTSAHSPPPPIATRVYETNESPPNKGDAGAGDQAKPTSTPGNPHAPTHAAAPGDACLDDCRTARKTCLGGSCKNQNCDCDGQYKTCVANCMK